MAAGDAAQLVRPEVEQSSVRGQVRTDDIACRCRDEGLATVRRRPESRRLVDVHPDVALVADLRLPLVEADPDQDRHTVWPDVVAQPPLDLERGGRRRCPARKDREELVCTRVDFPATVIADDRPMDPPVSASTSPYREPSRSSSAVEPWMSE